jgi:pre-rRNA-processing protein IPI3
MLTETLALSTLSPNKPNSSSTSRDVGVHLHIYQPLASLQQSFKKSSTAPNCLAVSSSHIFAAQVDKAVVHVYSREHGNQEAVVPFPEKIRSIALAGDYEEGTGCVVMGTEGGRLMVWEVRFTPTVLWDLFRSRRGRRTRKLIARSSFPQAAL